jgi:hypothetical protein
MTAWLLKSLCFLIPCKDILAPSTNEQELTKGPGSNGLGRCELDVSRLGTVGDCTARYTEFHAWADQRAYYGTLARSNDAGRNCLGTECGDSWYSVYALGGCYSFFHCGSCVDATF